MSKRQVAVMVDAGYFFKQGMEVLFGPGKSREEASLLEAEAVKLFAAKAKELFGREALRVYWYDAPPSKDEPSASQRRLALCDGVKTRMGTLNGCGQQKGVDGMIISDMTTLARNGAVDGILLVSGDEDLRLAMEEAQSYGVKVLILGVGEEGNASVSGSMAACSDGVRRLSKEEARSVLRLAERPRASQASPMPSSLPKKGSAKGKGPTKKGQAQASETRRDQTRVQGSASSQPAAGSFSANPVVASGPVGSTPSEGFNSRELGFSHHQSGEPDRSQTQNQAAAAAVSGPQAGVGARTEASRLDQESTASSPGQDPNESKRKNRRGSRPSRHQKQAQREQRQRVSQDRDRQESISPEASPQSRAAPTLPPAPQEAAPVPERSMAPEATQTAPVAARIPPQTRVESESVSPSVAESAGSSASAAPKPARKTPARKPKAEPAAERVEDYGKGRSGEGEIKGSGGMAEPRASAVKPARKRAVKPAPKKEG